MVLCSWAVDGGGISDFVCIGGLYSRISAGVYLPTLAAEVAAFFCFGFVIRVQLVLKELGDVLVDGIGIGRGVVSIRV